jgi:hypothetical protein
MDGMVWRDHAGSRKTASYGVVALRNRHANRLPDGPGASATAKYRTLKREKRGETVFLREFTLAMRFFAEIAQKFCSWLPINLYCWFNFA